MEETLEYEKKQCLDNGMDASKNREAQFRIAVRMMMERWGEGEKTRFGCLEY